MAAAIRQVRTLAGAKLLAATAAVITASAALPVPGFREAPAGVSAGRVATVAPGPRGASSWRVAPPRAATARLASGTTLQGNALAGVDEFLGIRYALPPVGGRRWRPTVDMNDPADGQRGRDAGAAAGRGGAAVVQATAFGPSCPQYGGQLRNATHRCFVPGPNDACSEDCLTLNVWRPAAPRDGSLVPLLFWVHGGGYTQGGSSEFNGSALALRHDVVVVTCNYRLGPLAFLALEGLEDPNATNAGMMDQQSAMRWARRHAPAFGADRGRVLLFGQSAGGGAVLTHMMMPASKGLFQAAMMESGGPFHFDPDSSATRAQAIVDAVGCGGGRSKAEVMECMRSMSVAALQDAAGDPTTANHLLDCSVSAANCTDFAPTFGVPNLPHDMLSVLLSPDPSRWLPAAAPLIIGHTPDDAMLFMVGADPDAADVDAFTSYVNASLTSRGYLRGYSGVAQAALPRVLNAYPPVPGNLTHNLAQLGSIATDLEFVCGAEALADALGRLSPPVPAYAYLFDYNVSWVRPCDLSWPREYGVCHTAELPFVWGQPIYSFGPPNVTCAFTPAESRFADDVGAFVARFAATGSPGNGWAAWAATGSQALRLHPPDGGGKTPYAMRPSERSAQCAMWRDIWRSRPARWSRGG